MKKSIPATQYTRDYYLGCCEGYEEFLASGGKKLPVRLVIPLDLAGVVDGMRIIDIGCGRGEIILHSAARGAWAWGLDYSREAVELAKDAIRRFRKDASQSRIGIQQADARVLPFEENSADVIFMLDVVEHLLPEELEESIREIWRILKPEGRLIIHTMPNLWYYKFGYPLFRLFQRMRGIRLPADPRERWAFSHVHVNEQTPLSLKRVLQIRGYDTKVWLQSTTTDYPGTDLLLNIGMQLLTKVAPFKFIFCNDIFAIGIKHE